MDDDFELNLSFDQPRAPKPKPKPQQASAAAAAPAAAGSLQKAAAAGTDPRPQPSKPTTQPAAGSGRGASHKQAPYEQRGHQPPRNNSANGAAAPQAGQQGRPQPGKQKPGKAAFGDPDDLLRFRDDDEDEDVASMVALALKRDAALESELQTSNKGRSRAAEPVGVVEFGDDDDEQDGRTRKRARLDSHHTAGVGGGGTKRSHDGSHHGAAGGGGRQRSGGADGKAAAQAAKAAVLKPGSLTHAGSAAGAAAVSGGTKDAVGGSSTWQGLGLSESLAQHLQSLKFEAPTVIQQQCIPAVLAGRDTLVKAHTGSGKTLCYLLPIIQELQAQEPRVSRVEGTYAICIAPTRELCIQIFDVATAVLKRYRWLVPGMLIGGENRNHEKTRLRKGVSLLAATPGRLLDHLQNTAAFKTGELRWLVLDEADRLLDLGFEVKLKQITDLLKERKQQAGGATYNAVLLSATLHKQLSALATLALRDPAVLGFSVESSSGGITLMPAGGSAAVPGGEDETAYQLPSTLRQVWLEVAAKDRLMALAAILRSRLAARRRAGGTKIVVFISSCDGVEFHHLLLGSMWKAVAGEALLPRGVPLLKLHGDMVQAERTATFLTFSKDGDGVLLCTDVAARGLDFPNVSTIVQYDVPGAPAEYVHRVGRTARMGASGEAILVLMPHEVPYANLLRSRGVLLEHEDSSTLTRWLPAPAEEQLADHKALKAARKGGDGAARQFAGMLHRRLVTAVSNDAAAAQLAKDAFRSYLRAYATHSGSVKRVFHVRNLHTGHVAHCYCLQETPTMLGLSGSSEDRKRKKREAMSSKQQDAKVKMRKAIRGLQQ